MPSVAGVQGAGLGERVHSGEGALGPHAATELQELDGPLDVGKRPRAELQVELRVFAGRDPLALDTCLHEPDFTDL